MAESFVTINPGGTVPGQGLAIVQEPIVAAPYEIDIIGPSSPSQFKYVYPAKDGDTSRDVLIGMLEAFQDNPSQDVSLSLSIFDGTLLITETVTGSGFTAKSPENILFLNASQMILDSWDRKNLTAQVEYEGKRYSASIDPAITDPLVAIKAIHDSVLQQYQQDVANKQAEDSKPDLSQFIGDDISSGSPIPP